MYLLVGNNVIEYLKWFTEKTSDDVMWLQDSGSPLTPTSTFSLILPYYKGINTHLWNVMDRGVIIIKSPPLCLFGHPWTPYMPERTQMAKNGRNKPTLKFPSKTVFYPHFTSVNDLKNSCRWCQSCSLQSLSLWVLVTKQLSPSENFSWIFLTFLFSSFPESWWDKSWLPGLVEAKL